jgi:transcriptional regulator with XRE-family HTH domain
MDLFSKRLEKLLATLDWTQNRLSRSTGITEQTITRWKRGNTPSKTSLKKISNATGCNIKWLESDDYQGPILEKGRWAFEADEKLATMPNHEIAQIYSRLKEIKEARGLNTPQLLEIANIHIHSTEDDMFFLGTPPYGRALEKISNATGYEKGWILTGIGPKYIRDDQVATPEKNGARAPVGGRVLELLEKQVEVMEDKIKLLEENKQLLEDKNHVLEKEVEAYRKETEAWNAKVDKERKRKRESDPDNFDPSEMRSEYCFKPCCEDLQNNI